MESITRGYADLLSEGTAGRWIATQGLRAPRARAPEQEPHATTLSARERPLPTGRCGNQSLLRQPSIGVGREQEVLGFPAQRLSETQDVATVVDGGRLRRTIAIGRQINRSRIRTPPEEMTSVVTSGLVESDDARSGIYSDCRARQFQYYGGDAVLEHSCHRLAI